MDRIITVNGRTYNVIDYIDVQGEIIPVLGAVSEEPETKITEVEE